MRARALVVAAPASGSGKTLVSLALVRALKARGLRVASAKVGPDYIDPRFHEAASGRTAFNLDPWAMRAATSDGLIDLLAHDSDLIVIEGVMGLFDGPARQRGSTADLAARLGLPVVLVIDAGHQAQSVAPLARGFADFRHDVEVAGVILNRTATERHAETCRFALREANIPVFGAVMRDAGLALPARHLGLVPAGEHPELETFIAGAAQKIASSLDLDAIVRLAREPQTGFQEWSPLAPLGQRIALAADAAFGFAYPHLLAGWRRAGAEIMPFSPLADQVPPAAADAVFLPGGYPELHAGKLASNTGFLAGLSAAAARGVLVYGECGGYMMLGQGLVDADGHRHAMAGLLPTETSFARRRLTLGYRHIVHASPLPFASRLRGHEFHYCTEAGTTGEPLFSATDASASDRHDHGSRAGTVMGSWLHVIDAEAIG